MTRRNLWAIVGLVALIALTAYEYAQPHAKPVGTLDVITDVHPRYPINEETQEFVRP